jgi:hypothetical protein
MMNREGRVREWLWLTSKACYVIKDLSRYYYWLLRGRPSNRGSILCMGRRFYLLHNFHIGFMVHGGLRDVCFGGKSAGA